MPTITDTHNNGRPGRPYNIRSAGGERVAGGHDYAWAPNIYRSLPWAAEDIQRDFGDDIWDRMLLDPQVWAALAVLKVGILAQGVKVLPCCDEKDPDYAKATELSEFCERQIMRLRLFRMRTLHDMLDAIPYGHKIAEILYEVPREGPDAGKLCLGAVKVRPRKNTALVVDAWMNVVGVLAVIPGQAPNVLQSTIIGDLRQMPNIMPRKKFAILSVNVRDEDPRGRSMFRPIYTPWWLKSQITPEWLKGVSQFGTPTIVAITSQMAAELPQKDATGAVVLDVDGNPIMLQPEVVLRDQVMAMQNGTVIAVPHDTIIETLKTSFDGSAVQAFIDYQDSQITRGILLQTLATQEGEHQARAAAQTHQDLLGDLVLYYRTLVEEMIEGDLLTPIVEANYGSEWLQWLPNVSLGDVESQDLAAMWAAVASLEKAGYLTPSQRRALDAIVSLPVRSEEETAIEAEAHAMGPDLLKEQQQQGDGAQDDAEGGGDGGGSTDH